MRLLLLGGTSEGRALAARLHPDVDVISSLAGRVPDPALPVGEVRIGGFGGVEGMRRWLVDSKVDAVVDATHPYAATITANAAAVCDDLGLPHLVLARPAWPPGNAIVVDSDAEAAKTVTAERYSRVFLTTGRSGTAAFADVDAWFLIRAVTAPDPDTLPSHHQLVLSRGPYLLRRRTGLAARSPHRCVGDQEQRRADDPAQAGCRGGARHCGGDGGPAAVAWRGDDCEHRRRRGGLGQIDG